MSVRRTALATLNAAEKRPWVVAVFLLALFVLSVGRHAARPLWYDELLTYHIASSSTWDQFAYGILHVDLNPPLQHILTFGALRVFGDSPLSTRLPSLVAFLIASLCLYRIAQQRLGTWYAATVVLLFWASPYFYLATEARPYALLIAFFGGAFLAWRQAADGRNRTAALWCLFACVSGMLWSQCFAVFLLVPFGIAELARWRQRRKADWAVCAVFVTSCALALPLYLWLLENARALVYPPRLITDWLNLLLVYLMVPFPLPAVAALLAALLVGLRPSVRKRPLPDALPASERVFLGSLLLVPLCLQLVLLRGQNPFWLRYAIGYGFFACLVLGVALHRFARRDLLCAVTAALALAVTVGLDTRPPFRSVVANPWYRRVSPDLPFVCASGLTFVEMNHRESAHFLSRVYYLNDRAAAQLAHATIFEGFPAMARYFNPAAQLVPYRTFTREHPRFLVLATEAYPEDWLLPKLAADGAVLKKLEQRETGYRDQTLFDVTLPAPPPAQLTPSTCPESGTAKSLPPRSAAPGWPRAARRTAAAAPETPAPAPSRTPGGR